MSRTHIFKLQRSLETTAPVAQVLAYNADRSIMGEFDSTPELDQLFKGRSKFFARGQLRKGKLLLLGEVSDRGW